MSLASEQPQLRYRKRPLSTLSPAELAKYLAAHRKLQRIQRSHNLAVRTVSKLTIAITTLERGLATTRQRLERLEGELADQKHKCWKAWQGYK